VDPIPPTIEWQRGRVRLIDQGAPSEPSSYRPARACSRIATRDRWRPSATAPLSASWARSAWRPPRRRVRTSAGERPDDEVVRIAGERIAPDGVPAANRAFDVTPARLVTAFVTERGVLRPLYRDALRAAASA